MRSFRIYIFTIAASAGGIALFATFGSILLVGLIGWALLFGYLVELIHNLNTGLATPLPRWANYTEQLRTVSDKVQAAELVAQLYAVLEPLSGIASRVQRLAIEQKLHPSTAPIETSPAVLVPPLC